jgi:hypothetical protein
LGNFTQTDIFGFSLLPEIITYGLHCSVSKVSNPLLFTLKTNPESHP